MEFVLIFVLGVALGAGSVFLFQSRLTKRVKESFDALSLKALRENSEQFSEQFMKLASKMLSEQTKSGEKDLEGKKQLIDQALSQTLSKMTSELEKVHESVTRSDKDREQKFGEISNQIKNTADQTLRLQETTGQLHTALSSTSARGQLGERMADDVLHLAGFIEGVNYHKNRSLDTTNTRPDYIFPLPKGLKVNMDVKFPWSNYRRYLEASGESEKETYKSQFLRDVKNRIKEITTREYINPEEHTVDYAIIFIPNEQVFAFISEEDHDILDEALKSRIIVCSPLTLFAVLSVIRQAVENFNLGKEHTRILSILAVFRKQWDAFTHSFDKMGKRIDEAQKEFNNLTTTRRNQLERPLKQIDDLRKQKGLSEPALDGSDPDHFSIESIEAAREKL